MIASVNSMHGGDEAKHSQDPDIAYGRRTAPASIDRHHSTSIDDDLTHSNTMKFQPDSYTRAEIDQLIEAIRREIVVIQRYIARRPGASASIDRRNNKSTDSHRRTSVDKGTNRGRLVPKVKSDMSDTHKHGEEISDDTYATLMRHQFNLESLGDRLRKVENTTSSMKNKWHRGFEAIRDFTASLSEEARDRDLLPEGTDVFAKAKSAELHPAMPPVGVKNGYDEVNVQIPEEEKHRKILRQIYFRNRFFFTKNLCGRNTNHRTRAQEGSLRSDQKRAPLGRYVATELYRNVDTTSIHASSSTLRCYLPNTVANPSHVPRHF
ncbi:hypothetical protein F2Q70_00035679 [Brassica cretica]|uniref:Uncharacterized protein n=1 Tax=Brassica cretica TaxID=69181 RepID=A0A8S9JRP7_BRACR|nr:hypothetical protein F2Q70_00035679 [Brassica cretica]